MTSQPRNSALFRVFMENTRDKSGDAGRNIAAETQNFVYAHSRIERRAQPLLRLLQAVGLHVSLEASDNRSAVRGHNTVVYAHIRHADMMLPESHITLFSAPRMNNADAKNDSPEDRAYGNTPAGQKLKIIVRPSGYGIITEDQSRHKSRRTEKTIFTIPQATAILKTYLLSTLPDQCGPIIGAQKPPTPKH